MSLSEMKIEITASAPAPTTNASTPSLIPQNMPEKRGKKNRPKVTQILALDSLNPTVPIAVPEAASALQEAVSNKSNSAPGSPNVKSGGKSKLFSKRLPKPSSPMGTRKYSDPTLGHGGRSGGRPKWLGLGFKGKKRSKSAEAMNGKEDSVSPSPSPLDEEEGSALFECRSSGSSLVEPEATPVATLPGQQERTFICSPVEVHNCPAHIPTITVSSHGGEPSPGEGGVGATAENGYDGDVVGRKFSQSSQKSQCSTLHSNSGTSGVGSLLSPSGDECEPGSVSDIESPLSPMSGPSSYRGSSEELRHFRDFTGVLSDTDCIEKDFPTTPISPSSDTETLATSPSQTRGFSPPCGGGEDSGSEMSGPGRGQKRKKGRSTSKVS